MKKPLDIKKWKAINKSTKKPKENPDAPPKESSGDVDFDKAIQELLKKKKP